MTLNVNHDSREALQNRKKKSLHLDCKRMCSFQGTLILNFGRAHCDFIVVLQYHGQCNWIIVLVLLGNFRQVAKMSFQDFFPLQKCSIIILWHAVMCWSSDSGGIWFGRAELELPGGSCIGNSAVGSFPMQILSLEKWVAQTGGFWTLNTK